MKFRKIISIALFATSTTAFVAPSTTAFAARTSSHKMATTEPPAIKLDPSETACVMIEYQNEFATEGGALHDAVKECMQATGTLGNSRKVMDAARDAGIKEGELFKAREWGSDFCDLMKPAENDIICKGKSGLCGFASTNLDFLLRQNGIKNVLLAGFLTNCCVESSMRSAYELGYNVYTLKDCCAATSIAAQDAAYEHNFGMFSVPTTSNEIIDALKA
eukprot:scaffold1309_cov214-Chaetoceros_neogracile.AAC.8